MVQTYTLWGSPPSWPAACAAHAVSGALTAAAAAAQLRVCRCCCRRLVVWLCLQVGRCCCLLRCCLAARRLQYRGLPAPSGCLQVQQLKLECALCVNQSADNLLMQSQHTRHIVHRALPLTSRAALPAPAASSAGLNV